MNRALRKFLRLVATSVLVVAGSQLMAADYNFTTYPDQTYMSGDVAIKFDVYKPNPFTPNGWPAVLLLHGGGWTTGDKLDYAQYGPEFARRGYVAVAINYRLAKDGDDSTKWPAQADDVSAAVHYLRTTGVTQWNVDPARIAALGDSAGGHLAAWQGNLPVQDPNRVNAVVAFAAPWDLTRTPPSDTAGCGRDDVFTSCEMQCRRERNFYACVANLFGSNDKAARAAASPYAMIDQNYVPTLLIHGNSDLVVNCSESNRAKNRFLGLTVAQPRLVYAFLDWPVQPPGDLGHPNLKNQVPAPQNWLTPTFQFLNWWRSGSAGPAPASFGACK